MMKNKYQIVAAILLLTVQFFSPFVAVAETITSPDSKTASEDSNASDETTVEQAAITEPYMSDVEETLPNSNSQDISDDNNINEPKAKESLATFSTLTGSWGTTNYTYDTSSKTLTLSAGTTGPYYSCPWRQSATLQQVEKIVFEGTVVVPDRPWYEAYSLFSGLTQLESIEGLEKLDTSNAKNLNYMFFDCTSLTSVDVSSFDTSNVVSMNCMFMNCNSLINLDLSAFTTNNVWDMSNMIYNCRKLETINLSSFDTSNVVYMTQMFYYCEKLKSLDLKNFNTAKVTEMSSMFGLCSSLKTLDLSSFDTTNVVNMTQIFLYCSSLESVNLSSFNTTNVTNMASLFSNCGALKQLDVSSFDTTNVTTMTNAFNNCFSLQTLVLGESSFFDSTVNLPNVPTIFPYTGNWLYLSDSSGNSITDRLTYTSSTLFSDYISMHAGTYVWEVQQSTVTISYIDQNGVAISENDILTGNIGDTYATKSKTITGYTLDETRLPDNSSGTYTKDLITISYIYVKNAETSSVTTKYVDQNGQKLLEDDISYGAIDSTYATKSKTITGYTLDETQLPNNSSGTYTEDPITVSYIYVKNAETSSVTTKYVDQNGQKLLEDDVSYGTIGAPYTTQSKPIAGYTLDKERIPRNFSGDFTEEAITVTYFYKKVDVLSKTYPDNKRITNQTLPQTGENNTWMMALIVTIAVSTATIGTIAKSKRRS